MMVDIENHIIKMVMGFLCVFSNYKDYLLLCCGRMIRFIRGLMGIIKINLVWGWYDERLEMIQVPSKYDGIFNFLVLV